MSELTKEQQEVWDRLKRIDLGKLDPARIKFNKNRNPDTGDVWYDIEGGDMYVYDGKAWLSMTT